MLVESLLVTVYSLPNHFLDGGLAKISWSVGPYPKAFILKSWNDFAI
jgi:hypothetical protein